MSAKGNGVKVKLKRSVLERKYLPRIYAQTPFVGEVSRPEFGVIPTVGWLELVEEGFGPDLSVEILVFLEGLKTSEHEGFVGRCDQRKKAWSSGESQSGGAVKRGGKDLWFEQKRSHLCRERRRLWLINSPSLKRRRFRQRESPASPGSTEDVVKHEPVIVIAENGIRRLGVAGSATSADVARTKALMPATTEPSELLQTTAMPAISRLKSQVTSQFT
ncbi:hypothetical protein COLO4_04997 [Corchorus olitorius]|uniref:Uncharacterized protein n=1 Tax=Corchorus olitorius TaxID=93759 RepID=A0A1R3KS63_9ROSI|nr:hypothetical protein COLO4_04997 [Corchorus olitorius]